MDTNYWGLICVPLGLAICFGPVLIATIMTPAPKDDSTVDDPNKH